MPSPLPVPISEGLSPKMRAFVEHYVGLGGRHQGRAAIMAGYGKAGADAIASRLLRRPDVLALLRHIVETRIKADAVASAETLKELRDSPVTPAAVRRQCANDLLDRAGMLIEKFATIRHVVEPYQPSCGEGLLEMLRRLAPDMGIEIVVRDQDTLDHFLEATKQLHRVDPDVIEGEFSDPNFDEETA